MMKALEAALAEVERLPAADQENIGRQMLTHVEKPRALRSDIERGVHSLDEGKGQDLETTTSSLARMHVRKDDRLQRSWSPEAEQDLFDIWDHIWASASARVADKILREIHHVCFVLGAWPEYGKARDDVREGVRSVSVSRYVVFYRVTKTAIEIVRVLDERRDVSAIFPEEARP